MRAAIYCRISLDRAGEGLGVERQETLCRKLAAERGWQVVEVYIDNDQSAFSGKARPAYDRLMHDLEVGLIDAVICLDVDRLTRRPAELEVFIELADTHKIALANVSGDTDLSSSDGRFKARIMGAVARQESEKKSERMRREGEHAAQRGIPRGSRRPFGYEADRITIRDDEAELIRKATQRVLNGATIPSIAREWNELAIPPSQGAKHGWLASSVAAILRNPRIAGMRAYHGEIVAKACWDPILDRETFDRLAAKIRRGTRPGCPPKRLLSGIAQCGRCGSPMWTSSQKHRGKQTARYACVKRPGAPGCGATTIVAERLDLLLIDVVLQRLGTKKMVSALKYKPAGPSVDLDLARIERDLEELAADFGAGEVSRREWLAARKPLEERRDRACAIVEAASGTVAFAPFRTGDIRAAWENLDVDRQRNVVEALMHHVTIGPAATPGRFDAERVVVEWRG